MSLDNSTVVPFISSGFNTTVANQSLRFNDDDSPYLSNTFSTPTNNKIATFSAWIKLSKVTDSRRNIFYCYDGSSASQMSLEIGSSAQSAQDNLFLLFGGGASYRLMSAAKLRDVSAWYHIVVKMDTTQATASDRATLYINGEEVTDFGTYEEYPPQNTVIQFGGANGTSKISSGGDYWDGYMTDIYFVDGEALGPEYFGETDATYGHWKPKADSELTLGDNGFHLDFSNASSLGEDQSNNGNNWTANNFSTYDQVPDSPTNNFATLNPLHGASGSYTNSFELKQGNLHLYNASASNQGTCSTMLMESGKWYWEIYIADTNSTYNHHIGVVNGASFIEPSTEPRALYRNDGIVYYSGTSDSSVSAMSAGDVMACALDADNNTIKFFRNGSQTGNTISLGDPGSLGWKTYTSTGQASSDNSYWNFGQDSSFAGNKTSGSSNASDGNSIGDFYYTPPSGYLALCTSNLAAPNVVPSENFNTILWTGNGTSGRSITGVGFQPDCTWFKCRSAGEGHQIYDAVRGTSKVLYPDYISAEQSRAGLTSFNSDGFTVGSFGEVNGSGKTYVGWNWKGANGTSSNTNGSITTTVSANQDAGFSIFTYSGNSTGPSTLGHGLSQTPEFFWLKSRSYNEQWGVWHKDLSGSNDAVHFENVNAATGWGSWLYSTAPTSSVITIGGYGQGVNNSGQTYYGCAFHSVEGFSKVGSYTGNASTDGPFGYTGFRPRWIMIKNIGNIGWWTIYDTAREPTNDGSMSVLSAHSSGAESTELSSPFDILSNGFKIRSGSGSSDVNSSGVTYIYIAFAETPFKYTNAR